MATTTNYGWETPDDTDLVKDGAAAIRTLGSSIDTTTKNLNPETTLGDIAYRSSTSNTNTRLAIGTNGQVLTVASGVPSWATATTYNPNYQLINAGGTALTGASSVTVSGISGKTNLLVVVDGASASVGNAMIFMRFNADSGSNYAFLGSRITPTTFFSGQTLSQSTIDLGYTGSSAADTVSAIAIIDGANAAGYKPVTSSSVASGTSSQSMVQTALYKGTSAITSVTIHTDAGNLDAGTVYVYGA